MSGDQRFCPSQPQKTHYVTLGVPSSATIFEIRRAYRTLALQWHPDKQEPGASDQIFKQITEAYAVLSDEEKRRAYDETLRQPVSRASPMGNAAHSQSFHFSSFHQHFFSDFFPFEDVFGEFFRMHRHAPFPFRRTVRPYPISKQIICDLTADEGERYYVQVHWSDGGITHEPL